MTKDELRRAGITLMIQRFSLYLFNEERAINGGSRLPDFGGNLFVERLYQKRATDYLVAAFSQELPQEPGKPAALE